MGSHRRRMFVVLFCIALVGLLADRLFILPRSAGARDEAVNEQPDENYMLETTYAPLVTPKTQQVADRLASLCTSERILEGTLTDAFALPEAWMAQVDPNGSLMGRSDKVAEFKNRYELSAVAENSGEYCAFINDKRYRVGQVLSGFTLVAVDEGSATFEADGLRFVLRMKNNR